MHLALIGFMGVGKTTVGQRVAKLLGWKFYDTDEMIQEASGLEIPEIFREYGETHFRDLESNVVQQIANKRENSVISTGGGVVVRPLNMVNLRMLGPLVWLRADINTLMARIDDDGVRPLLSQPDDSLHKLFELRNTLYKRYADISINATSAVETVVEGVLGVGLRSY